MEIFWNEKNAFKQEWRNDSNFSAEDNNFCQMVLKKNKKDKQMKQSQERMKETIP